MRKSVTVLPYFIIIGAMKSGTSSLFRYLSTHPDLVPSCKKETNFFLRPSEFDKGIGYYQDLFTGPGTYAFEASPNYTKRTIFPGVPERMHSVVPGAKLIYVVRNPVDRIVSHYLHSYSVRREDLNFSESIRRTDSRLIDCSRYSFQLDAFLEYYSKENIHLVQSEKLDRDAEGVLGEIANFLEIPFEFDREFIVKKFHKSSKKRRMSKVQHVVNQRTSNRHVRRLIKNTTGFLATPIAKPVPTEDDREWLKSALHADVERLRKFSGQDFVEWPF